MGLVKTGAIILRTYKLAEADKIAACLTEKSGMIRGVARGARRLLSKFGAGLEPFTVVNLTYFEKEGRELVTIKESEILRSYFHVALEPETIETLEYLAQLMEEFAPPRQVDERLFRMMRACVEAAAQSPTQVEAVARYFELWILKLSGFLPDILNCVDCRKRLGDNPASAFLNFERGLRCADCSGEGELYISTGTQTQFASMHTFGPSEWAQRYMMLSRKSQEMLSDVTRRWVRNALEKEPRRGRLSPGPSSL
ncbi:MAG: DNA repair protein RecO [Acidobacteria bacterium]|nr:DNA repair protein RecO [Acidobacteriota bacterium]